MRALRFFEFGEPSKLSLVDLPDPIADATTAVVRIVAGSVNPSDVKNVAGHMEGTVLPRVPGRDFSGVVEHGPREWLGAAVWGTGGAVGFSEDGTHAERIAWPVAALVRKPANLAHELAATVGVSFLIAWIGADYAAVREGETVAVIGAGGGVGGAAVQIAKGRGCRIIGVDRGQRPPPPAGALIDEFVSTDGDVAAQVRQLTGGQGAEVVFDAVGGVLFEAALGSLGHRGRLVEISATGKRRVDFDLIDFYHRELRIFGADTRKFDSVASAKILADLVGGLRGRSLPRAHPRTRVPARRWDRCL
jgi:NADPH:quinone reductase-like Zn-dependent oxidoreductase